MAMYEIKADQEKNRLYVTLSGSVSADESVSIFESIKSEISIIKPGFACIADLTKFKIKPEHAEWMLQIQDMLSSSGMSQLIRIGDPMYRELLEKHSKKEGYSGKIVYDLETALKIVDQRD